MVGDARFLHFRAGRFTTGGPVCADIPEQGNGLCLTIYSALWTGRPGLPSGKTDQPFFMRSTVIALVQGLRL